MRDRPNNNNNSSSRSTMRVNAVFPLMMFAVLMVGGLLTCYLVAIHTGDVQRWIPYISDTGLRGIEHLIFAELLNMAAYVGVTVMLLRHLTVAVRTDDLKVTRTNRAAVIIGSVSAFFLSFVANFPEGQPRGIGVVHLTSAAIVFGGGCVFSVVDTVITGLVATAVERDRRPLFSDDPAVPFYRSIRWFEWIRLVVAFLSVVALVLCITGKVISMEVLNSYRGNMTLIIPHWWSVDEPGYAMHVQGALCEWLLGLLFVIYCLTFAPELYKFEIHVSLAPRVRNELIQPGERDPLQRRDENRRLYVEA